jgi:hypothetical protein
MTSPQQREDGLEALAVYVAGLASEVASLELRAAKVIAAKRGDLVAFTLRRQAQERARKGL